MDLNDFMPGPSIRPDHPDFWRLSEIILKMDGRMEAAQGDEDKEAAWQSVIAECGIDERSATYMSMQRAFRVMGVETVMDLSQPGAREMAGMLAVVYLEGIMTGIQFNQGRQP